jgi:hypothetical protein
MSTRFPENVMNSRNVTRALIALALAQSSQVFADPPSNSAYATDVQSSHVEDATSRGIGQVNMITCIMGALRADALVNDGAYNALVSMPKCDPESRSSADANGTTGSQFATATVNSTRASNTDPMRARIWLDDPESEGAAIFINLTASAAPTLANPYGIFRVDYCGNFEGDCIFNGFLDGSTSGVSYFEREQGDGGGGTKALRMTATSTTSGSGRLHLEDGNNANNSSTFSFAYNADYYRRSDDGGDQCFARDARDPDTGMSVWRYGLYDSTTGARIERDSGFPIEYTNNGVKYQGYLGYYGLSLPPAAQSLLANGDTVEKVDYGNGNAPTRTSFTVVKAGGKLSKFTRHTRNLRGVDGIKLTTFVGNEAAGMYAGAQANTTYELYWDEAAGDFKVTGVMNCSMNGCNNQTLPNSQAVAASFFAARGIQGYSQQLGGEVFVSLQGVGSPVDSAAVQVVYRSQDVVYPSELPATLHCVRDCPTAASMAAYFSPGSQAPSPYAGSTSNNFQPTQGAALVHYSGDAANAMLLDGAAAPVVLNADPEQLQQSPQFRNGLRSGKLFANLADAECDVGSGTYCDWRVNNLEVYYQWETGPNPYNQFAAVKNANGQFVNLDAPLQVSFAVPQGAAFGTYAGKSIVLQYGGFGELYGLPGICVSPQTNAEVSCEGGGDVRYVPSFVIPYSTTQGVVTADGTTYLVKWLEREIRFARKSLGVCDAAGLTVPSGITLPTANDLKNPSNPDSDIYIGVRPAVAAAPRVIHGEVKY